MDCSFLSYIHSIILHFQVVMLDENGQDIGSEQMAELVGDAGNTVWAPPTLIAFWNGPPFFLLQIFNYLSMKVEFARWHDEVKAECDLFQQNMDLYYPISKQAISFAFDDPIYQQNMYFYFSLRRHAT